jgi:glucose-6-phosphate isomerase
MQEMFAKDTNRAEKFHINWNNFLVDYSKNIISEETQNYY